MGLAPAQCMHRVDRELPQLRLQSANRVWKHLVWYVSTCLHGLDRKIRGHKRIGRICLISRASLFETQELLATRANDMQ